MRRTGAFLALLLAGPLAGCTGGEPANPNILAPKLVVAARPDGNLTVYLHSAFREVVYDWVSLRVDNRTVANRSDAFSLEEIVPGPGAFLAASAGVADEMYELQLRLDLDPDDEDRVRVASVEPSGRWSDPRERGLPFEDVLDRRRPLP